MNFNYNKKAITEIKTNLVRSVSVFLASGWSNISRLLSVAWWSFTEKRPRTKLPVEGWDSGGVLCGRVGLKISTLAGIDTDITLLFQSWDKSISSIGSNLRFSFLFSPWLKILSLCSNSVIIIITKRPLLQEGCWLLRHSPTNPLVFTSYLQQKALRLNPSPLFLVPVFFFFFFWEFFRIFFFKLSGILLWQAGNHFNIHFSVCTVLFLFLK